MQNLGEIQDPIELAIFQNSMHSIAEEMGAALRRTSISPNIKERRDYSCALFDSQQRVIAMGDHMPVHLGAMPMSVKAVVEALELQEGDMAILNDPYAGGTHLPDITLVLPIFMAGSDRPAFYAASRAHHADVGGMYAGSMGPAQEIYQEGLRIPPVLLMRGGKMERSVLAILLANVRTPEEREGDLAAQIGACHVGERRIQEIVAKYGLQKVQALTEELIVYSERLTRAELKKMPAGVYEAEDFLDNDGVTDELIRIAVSIRLFPEQGAAEIDFSGSSPQVRGSVNAVYPITYSACFYMLRCLLGDAAPATSGIMNPVIVEGSGRKHRERQASRPGGRRQRGSQSADHRCVASCVSQGRTRQSARGKLRNHEQPDHRRCRPTHASPVHVLRDYGRRHGRAPWDGGD